MTSQEAVPTRWQHTDTTWAKRKAFANLFGKACLVRDIELTWLDEEMWTGIIRNNARHAPIYGYDLGLNSSAAAKISDSKADTHAVLQYHGIPSVSHERISPYLTNGDSRGWQDFKPELLEKYCLPLVVKPDAAVSGGEGVKLCTDEATLAQAINSEYPIAVSPYRDFDEYRAVILDGKSLAVIQKTRDPNSWMHNHSKGAEHTLMGTDSMSQQIGQLGVKAARAIDLRFATVDIADITTAQTSERLQVLEINESVSVVYPDDQELTQVAVDIYGAAAEARLQSM